MFLHVIFLLFFLLKENAAFKCYTCTNIEDPDDCHNITEREDRQSCFAIVENKGKTKTFTLGITEDENCGTIPIYNITRRKREVEKQCFECCSRDKCNNRLCQHRKPSKCIDDIRVDCAHMNVMFNICKNVHQAKKICPEFCRLCSLVDGNWADWSEWSYCDVTCDSGIHIRKRTCTNPAPAYHGQECEGNSTETKPCNNMLCPVNGGWSEWSDWGTCSVSCDTGLKKRNRSCSSPYPQRTGVHCFGDSVDVEICKQAACIDEAQTVAFRADMVSDISFSNNKVIVFSRSTLNIGNAYNNKTGVFVAPVPGLYKFTAQICLKSSSQSYFGIVVKGSVVTKSLIGDQDYTKCYTIDALTTVGLNDEASINCLASCDSSDTLYRNGYMVSSFSGFII